MATELDGAPSQRSGGADSSHLRLRAEPAAQRAVRRVANYLRTLGLSDRGRLRELSHRIVLSVSGDTPEAHAARAVAEARARFEAWRDGLFAALPEGVHPLWLREFIRARPELFLGDVERARRAARGFGDPLAGRGPRRARFRQQSFEPARLPSWFLGALPPALLTAGATHALFRVVARDGATWLEIAWVSLFAFLFFQAATGLSTAALGFFGRRPARARHEESIDDGFEPVASEPSRVARSTPERPRDELPSSERPVAQLEVTERGTSSVPSFELEAAGLGRDGGFARHAAAGVTAAGLPRTALLMPIYHESSEEVFAALAGMRESLAALPGGAAFEIFVLSDSRDPEICADEERAYRRVVASGGTIPVYYHRRARNERQKAGNLAEFFERWGPRYKYAVTLDADSIMSGRVLIELVRRMEANPKLALLQAPIALHGGETLFARNLQFAASVCGPVFTRGLARWSGPHGNYYGHNAVIRVSAFLDCCALPTLHGEPPFGGHVLSHDFVEAALLCRAGWEVRLAHDLEGGSYEGLPPTLPEYVARDRRWCQGNMQHLRIAQMQGLEPMSRIHMVLGACAYLAGPAWFLFMVLGVLQLREADAAFREVALVVGLVTLGALLGPWLFGWLDTVRDAVRRRAHGGALRLIGGVLVGIGVGASLAPLLMVHHTRIVGSMLAGQAVGWGAQQRQASSNVAKVIRSELPATVLGASVALWAWFDGSGLFLWLAPLWGPWLLAIPLSAGVSSVGAGRVAERLGLLLVPSESAPEPLLRRVDALRVLTRSDACARYRTLVLDPVLVAAHLAKLEGKPPSAPPKRLAALRRRALREGPASLSAAEWRLLAEDAESIRILHRDAWQCWPVESWDTWHGEPQLPPETARSARAADGSDELAASERELRGGLERRPLSEAGPSARTKLDSVDSAPPSTSPPQTLPPQTLPVPNVKAATFAAPTVRSPTRRAPD